MPHAKQCGPPRDDPENPWNDETPESRVSTPDRREYFWDIFNCSKQTKLEFGAMVGRPESGGWLGFPDQKDKKTHNVVNGEQARQNTL